MTRRQMKIKKNKNKKKDQTVDETCIARPGFYNTHCFRYWVQPQGDVALIV